MHTNTHEDQILQIFNQGKLRVTEKEIQLQSEFPVSLTPYQIHIPELVLHAHMYVYQGKTDRRGMWYKASEQKL